MVLGSTSMRMAIILKGIISRTKSEERENTTFTKDVSLSHSSIRTHRKYLASS